MNLYEKVFDFWTIQESLESLPQVVVKIIEKDENKKSKRISKRTYPSYATIYNIFENRNRKFSDFKFYPTEFTVRDFSKIRPEKAALPFVKLYCGVFHPNTFFDFMLNAFGVSKDSVIFEEIKDIYPTYLFSLFTSPQGSFIYSYIATSPDGIPYSSAVVIPSVWFLLREIADGNNMLPEQEKLRMELKSIQEEFLRKFTRPYEPNDPIFIRNFVLDTSFLIKFAPIVGSREKIAENNILTYLKDIIPSVRFYVPYRVIRELEAIKEDKDEKTEFQRNKAKSALIMLEEFFKVYKDKNYIEITPEREKRISEDKKRLIDKYGFSETDAACVATALRVKKINENKPEEGEVAVLATDSTIAYAASKNSIYCFSDGVPYSSMIKPDYDKGKAGKEFVEAAVDFFVDKIFSNSRLKDVFKELTKTKSKTTKTYSHSVAVLDFAENNDAILNALSEETEESITTSFFSKDIAKAKKLYLDNKHEALSYYINGNNEPKEVDYSIPFLKSVLSPKRIPLARWPIEKGRYLFLSQYIAVSSAYYHFLEQSENKIIGVNGPPGTGKTTLLKDYIANSIVKTAEEIVKTKNKEEKFFIAAKNGIIVSSSNNNAVFNVSKELPSVSKNAPISYLIDRFIDAVEIDNDYEHLYEFIINSYKDKTNFYTPELEYVMWLIMSQISTASIGLVGSQNAKIKNVLADYDERVKNPIVKELLKKLIKKIDKLRDNEKPDQFQEQEKFENYVICVSAALGRNEYRRTFLENFLLTLNSLMAELKTQETEIEKIELEKKRAGGKLGNLLSNIYEKIIVPSFNAQIDKVRGIISKITEYREIYDDYEHSKSRQKSLHKEKKEIEDEIKEFISSIDEIDRKIDILQTSIESSRLSLESIEIEIHDKEDELKECDKFISFLLRIFSKKRKEKYNELKREIKELKLESGKIKKELGIKKAQEEQFLLRKRELENNKKELENTVSRLQKEIEQNQEKIKTLERAMDNIAKLFSISQEKREDFFLPDLTILKRETREDRERFKPYANELLKKEQEKLFLAALRVLIFNVFLLSIDIAGKINTLKSSFSHNVAEEEKEDVQKSWGALFLTFPVVSTTFHSLASLFASVDTPNFFGTLIVDEAGQALPQMALGGLYRTKRALIVGDPLQLEPVVTIPKPVLQKIAKSINIPDNFNCYLGGVMKAIKIGETYLDSSVQVLADRASIYRANITIKDCKIDVGIPLKVHFRCDRKIMEAANSVAYGGAMVHFNPKADSGVLKWLDIKTEENKDKWVGNASLIEINVALQLAKEIMQKNKDASLYIISPFKDVIKKLYTVVKESKINLSLSNIGTVHTFQGKEAEIVIFVLGGSKEGSRNWAASKPNLVNVALTRAKKEFYVVGDFNKYSSLPFFDEIAFRSDILRQIDEKLKIC